MPRSQELRIVSYTARRSSFLALLALLTAAPQLLHAQAQPDPGPLPKTDIPAATQPQALAPATSGGEVTTHDAPATFKVRVNLVLVRVVVRDAKGAVIPNLKREDFQLFDNRKPQVISSFSVETPDSHAIIPASKSALDSETAPLEPEPGPINSLPQRFVGLVFDDINMKGTDTVSVRAAASRLFNSVAPSDRIAIYSTSGQITQEFTADHNALRDKLSSVVPHPLINQPGLHNCPDVDFYEADLIANNHDDTAMNVATEDAIQCAFNNDQTKRAQAQALAQAVAQTVSSQGETQVEYLYRHIDDVLRRLAGMPGQRVMVFISPGFALNQHTRNIEDLFTRANRSNIVINTIDARGLYVPEMGDIGDPPHDSTRTFGYKTSYRLASQASQTEILLSLAEGTGGTAYRNSNDLNQGFREAAAAPAVSYLLSFSPQNMKIDGRFHTLKVDLVGKPKYSIQARHGYYAPRTIIDPAEAARLEIQEAVFSQEEMHDLPVDLQTQYFKADQNLAKLAVLAHVDVKGIQLRRLEGRNRDDLTIAMAIFDENGNYVTGAEKIVEMRLRDETLAHISRNGFTVKSSFDVKPGSYLVRMVVRDSEGAQMSARNGAVVIPN
jgi:VWFA-related protein